MGGLGNKGLGEMEFHRLKEMTRPFDQMGVRDDFRNVRGVIGHEALNRSVLGKNVFPINPRLDMETGGRNRLVDNACLCGSNVAAAVGKDGIPVVPADRELEGRGTPHTSDPILRVILGVSKESIKGLNGLLEKSDVNGL